MKKGIFLCLLCFASYAHGSAGAADSATTFFVDILAWKLREGSADNWAQEISPAGTTRTANVLGVPFGFSPGLRLGVVNSSALEHWDTVLSYTGFKTNASSQATVTSGGIYSPFLGNFYVNNTSGTGFGPNYRSASVQWKLNFNIIDLELGYKFKIDQYLQLRPFIGIKGGWIYQKIYSSWVSPTVAVNFTSATENLKNDFYGIGPAIGLDSTWAIYTTTKSKFNLVGNFSGALLWGYWSFSDIYQNNAPLTVAINTDNINGASPMIRGFLGVEWATILSQANINIRLGYEAQIWFSQMQYYSFNMGRLNNLMSLQGGVVGLSVNF